MTSFIPKLARISSRSQARTKRKPSPAATNSGRATAPGRVNIEYLAGLVPVVRHRLDIEPSFSDTAIFASLAAIAARSTYEERWQAAQASTLGLFLSSRAKDLNAALVTILALLPKP